MLQHIGKRRQLALTADMLYKHEVEYAGLLVHAANLCSPVISKSVSDTPTLRVEPASSVRRVVSEAGEVMMEGACYQR